MVASPLPACWVRIWARSVPLAGTRKQPSASSWPESWLERVPRRAAHVAGWHSVLVCQTRPPADVGYSGLPCTGFRNRYGKRGTLAGFRACESESAELGGNLGVPQQDAARCSGRRGAVETVTRGNSSRNSRHGADSRWHRLTRGAFDAWQENDTGDGPRSAASRIHREPAAICQGILVMARSVS